ncbi:MAG TPA: RQC-minor-1 family DNA-binding protein [Longimicrobiaceae bacterium]
MSRRVHRVPYHLDDSGVRRLPPEEIAAVLRGADDLIMRGGRTLLAKVLKGSREKRVLELELDRSPVYGRYREISTEEVLHRIDWVIRRGYLRIEYDYRLPLLVYTPAGWEIEKETYAREKIAQLDEMLAAGPPYPTATLKEMNKQVKLRMLDLLLERGDPAYLPVLHAWKRTDSHKMRPEIARAIRLLRGGDAGFTEEYDGSPPP